MIGFIVNLVMFVVLSNDAVPVDGSHGDACVLCVISVTLFSLENDNWHMP